MRVLYLQGRYILYAAATMRHEGENDGAKGYLGCSVKIEEGFHLDILTQRW